MKTAKMIDPSFLADKIGKALFEDEEKTSKKEESKAQSLEDMRDEVLKEIIEKMAKKKVEGKK